MIFIQLTFAAWGAQQMLVRKIAILLHKNKSKSLKKMHQ